MADEKNRRSERGSCHRLPRVATSESSYHMYDTSCMLSTCWVFPGVPFAQEVPRQTRPAHSVGNLVFLVGNAASGSHGCVSMCVWWWKFPKVCFELWYWRATAVHSFSLAGTTCATRVSFSPLNRESSEDHPCPVSKWRCALLRASDSRGFTAAPRAVVHARTYSYSCHLASSPDSLRAITDHDRRRAPLFISSSSCVRRDQQFSKHP